MTRKEQILNKAIDYSEIEENFLEYDDCGDVCDDKEFIQKAFEEGAKWADSHPNLSEEEQVGMGSLGMMWQKKALIDKACKWLQDSVYDRYIEMHEDNIEDFRKAMEEE